MASSPTPSKSRPPYKDDVDFAALALKDEDFAKIFNANGGKLNFKDPKAVKQLTISLLKRDFDLTLELPDDRLCPPIPVRYNYIAWLQDLVDSTSDKYEDSYDAKRPVVGIDIGVGASCIFPLLGCASRTSWRFGGTDIDGKNLNYAKRNVDANNLSSRIRLLKTDHDGPLLPLDRLGIEHADFTICNPPFYASKEAMQAANAAKEKPPSAVCTGADIEMITDGGDAGYVIRMIAESAKLRERIQWYSSMLGKLESVNLVVDSLRGMEITNYAVASLRAGNKTNRWAIAWSFGDMKPANDVARREMTIKDLLPFPTEFSISTTTKDLTAVKSTVDRTMSALDVRWIWKENRSAGIGFARENVWSRAARRRKKMQGAKASASIKSGDSPEDVEMSDDDDFVALGIKITVKEDEVHVRWLRGTDSVLFESFCGMLKRAITS